MGEEGDGLGEIPVYGDNVDGVALDGFVHQIISMALVAADATGGNEDAGVVDDRLHLSSTATCDKAVSV